MAHRRRVLALLIALVLCPDCSSPEPPPVDHDADGAEDALSVDVRRGRDVASEPEIGVVDVALETSQDGDQGDVVCNEEGVDHDHDGVPDECDLCREADDLTDDDGDGVPNACDVCPVGDDGLDGDGDGKPDSCDCGEAAVVCHQNAYCTILEAGIQCHCLIGYTGDGVTLCNNIDECLDEPCAINADCEDNDGGFTCECQPGWGGDPYDIGCSDVINCLAHPCAAGALCVDEPEPQTFSCHCGMGWESNDPASIPCTMVDCGAPPTVISGSVIADSTIYGAEARYRCDPGHILSGDDRLECLETGDWSGSAPLCAIVDCGAPPAIIAGTVTTETTAYGAEAIYACASGHALSGSDTLICLETGSWSDSAPTCTLIDCGPPPTIENGTVTSDSTTFDAEANYDCSLGFSLAGSETLMCLETGSWSDLAPVCTVVDCGTPTPIDNGTVEVSDGTMFDADATYSCDPLHVLSGNPTLTCLESGDWSDVAPICTLINCGAPPAVSDGTVTTLLGTTVGEWATYQCNSHHIMSGSDQLTCLESGVWNGSAPACVPYGDIVLIGHDYSLSNTDMDSIVANAVLLSPARPVVRVLGYEQYADTHDAPAPFGEVGATQDAIISETSEGVTVQFLEPLTDYTQLPARIDEADVLLIYEQELGGDMDEVGLSWSDTLRLFLNRGGVVVVCDHLTDGWRILNASGALAVAGRGDSINDMNVNVLVDDHPLAMGVNSTYIALSGSTTYVNAEVDVTIVVQTDAGQPVVIHHTALMDCSQPDSPENGWVETPSGTAFGAVATVYCNPEYKISGEPHRMCGVDGEWSGPAPECGTHLGGAFAGYANWLQNGTVQSDAQQDALIEAACETAYPGSRPATMEEIGTPGAITGLPSYNDSGNWLIGVCPHCEGDVCTACVEGHARNCVDRNGAWPSTYSPWPMEDYCYSSTRSTICLGGD